MMRVGETRIRILGVVGLVVALCWPAVAEAKKPPQPVDPPQLWDVTMMLVGEEGLATNCDDGDGIDGSILMESGGDGLYAATLDRLGLYVQEVDSSRLYPEPVSSVGFSGCHGARLDGGDSIYGGLGITLDATGAVTDLLWHFDYYYVIDQVTLPNGRVRTSLQLMEHFTLSGHDLQWTPATDTSPAIVSGWFNVLYHLEDVVNHVSIGYEPVVGSPRLLTFTFEMQPHG